MPIQKGVEDQSLLFAFSISESYSQNAEAIVAPGDCLTTLKTLPDGLAKLIITSPPYNIGKAYEKATDLNSYLDALQPVANELTHAHSHQLW